MDGSCVFDCTSQTWLSGSIDRTLATNRALCTWTENGAGMKKLKHLLNRNHKSPVVNPPARWEFFVTPISGASNIIERRKNSSTCLQCVYKQRISICDLTGHRTFHGSLASLAHGNWFHKKNKNSSQTYLSEYP